MRVDYRCEEDLYYRHDLSRLSEKAWCSRYCGSDTEMTNRQVYIQLGGLLYNGMLAIARS